MSTPKIPVDSTNAWHPKGWPICDTNDPDITSLIGQRKFFLDICGLQPTMNTPPRLQPIMDTTYPTGPNQLWAPKENSEP